MCRLQFLTLLLSTACLLGQAARAGDTDPAVAILVGQIVQAHGGAVAIERVTALNAEGEIQSPLRNDHGAYKRWLQRPRLLRLDIAYQRGTESRILNGDQVWRSDGAAALKYLTGMSALAVIYQYKQLDLPYGLLKDAYRLSLAGEERVGDLETVVLEVRDAEGPPMRVNVDRTSQRIVRVSGRIESGSAAMELAVVFSDYRLVEGVPMPFRLQHFAGGMAVSDTVIARYSINPVQDEALFTPPIKGHHGKVLSLRDDQP
jgi:hypothetical protein